MPEHLQLTETNNPGALKWLKKTDKIGMPRAIKSVVKALAALRGSTSERISRSIHMNFSRLLDDDPWLHKIRDLFFSPRVTISASPR